MHELIHGLGALQGVNAPNECAPPDDGHVCDSTTDVLYPSANSQTTISGQTLDAGRNDYYGHSLAGFDVQDSGWLTHLPQQRLSVTIQRSGTRTGVVRLVSPTSFECAQSCTLELDQGLAVTLVATPRAGARFLRWTGACTGSGPCAVTLDAARTVTAVFGVTTVPPHDDRRRQGQDLEHAGRGLVPGPLLRGLQGRLERPAARRRVPGLPLRGLDGQLPRNEAVHRQADAQPLRPRDVPQEVGLGRRATKSGAAVRDESLLEEMRAAVRGDRQRAEKRRATPPSQPAAEEAEPRAEDPPAEAAEAEPEEDAGWFRRFTRRRRSA